MKKATSVVRRWTVNDHAKNSSPFLAKGSAFGHGASRKSGSMSKGILLRIRAGRFLRGRGPTPSDPRLIA